MLVWRIFLLCLMGSVLANAQAVTLHLQLQENATVSARKVVLADIAVVRSLDRADTADARQATESQSDELVQQLVQQLMQTTISAAPRVNALTRLSRLEVEHALRSQRLANGIVLAWQGAQAVQVRSAQQVFPAAQLVQAAQQALQQQLQEKGESVQANLLGEVPDLALPLGAVQIKPRAMPALTPSMPVLLDVYVDGQFYRTQTLLFALSGQLLQKHMVSKGSVVDLQLTQGGVVLQTRAIAQHDARIGEMVKVKLPHSAELVSATVRSSTLLEMR